MKKHILVISQYFYPEQFRINDICTEWIKRGYQVTVVTGIPNYPQGKFYNGYGLFKKTREMYNGVEVIRIPLVPRGKNAMMLSLNYLSFVVTGFFWNLFTKIKADAVFIFEVSPMTQALPGVWYSKKRKIPCYLYVQDLWPENVEIITGITNKKVINTIGKMVDYIYRNCTRIFTTSNSFITSIVNRGVPKEKLTFWPQYAEDFYIPLSDIEISEIPKDDRFNIIFAGNIGQAQGLGNLPKVAKLLKSTQDLDICFNIVGDGRYKEELIKLVKDEDVESMFRFIPKQPAERIPEFLANCDVAYLGLADNPLFEMTIPAKLQSYLACGIPILASANGETKEIIEQSKTGLCSAPSNTKQLADNLIKMAQMDRKELQKMGETARIYYSEHFEKKELLDKMDTYFNRKF